MISLRLKSSMTIALICFVAGCCTAFLLMTNCGTEKKKGDFIPASLLKKQADSLKVFYQGKISELETSNKQLTVQLNATKAELNAAKLKANGKAAEIKKLIEPKGYPAKQLLEKAGVPAVLTEIQLQECDSLKLLVSDFIIENEIKDNLYEQQARQQDSLLTGKDAVIALQEGENLNLSILFKQSTTQQQILEKDNQLLRKQVKRKKKAGRWLAIGSAVVSGLATHYITNR
jgi:hypothetical protein